MYVERPSRLRGAAVWTSWSARTHLVLPDGCMDLIWDGRSLFVAGPDTTAHPSLHSPGTTFVGLRFAPGTAPSVLGLPAHELRDQRVPIDDLWSSSTAERLQAELCASTDPGALLEHIASTRRVDRGPAEAMIEAISQGMLAGRPVAQVASEVGLSERQLHRRSLDAFGYGPKTLARILRLHRALDLLRAGVPTAMSAVRAGYADQPHLSREAQRLAGVPLGELLRPPT